MLLNNGGCVTWCMRNALNGEVFVIVLGWD